MNGNLGEFLYNLRQESGKTIKELKVSLGISHQYINDLENNKRVPSNKLLEAIARTYNLNSERKIKLYDLATQSSKTKKVPVDIENYILENEEAKEKIRKMIYEEENYVS